MAYGDEQPWNGPKGPRWTVQANKDENFHRLLLEEEER